MAADPARPPDDQEPLPDHSPPPPDHPRPPLDAGERAIPAADLLGTLAALGPYFAVEVHPPGSPPRPPWQPLNELTATLTTPDTLAGRDALAAPDALTARISEVRERLAATAGYAVAEVEFRVAASVTQLGLCARLLSPVLGAAASGWPLPVDAARAWWVPALGGPFRLSLPELARPERSGPAAAPEAACLDLLDGPISQLVRAVTAMAVSPRVLWGNVASAVSGAAAMVMQSRPDLAGPAARAATAMLGHPSLAGTYRGEPGAGFRRRNCCLIYRLSIPGPARYCGDCILGPHPA